jgi:hypothetical protein
MTNQTISQLINEYDRASRHFENMADDSEFERAAEANLDTEDAIREINAGSIDDPSIRCAVLQRKFAIFARRALGGFDVSEDLANLSGLALTGLGLVLVPTELV